MRLIKSNQLGTYLLLPSLRCLQPPLDSNWLIWICRPASPSSLFSSLFTCRISFFGSLSNLLYESLIPSLSMEIARTTIKGAQALNGLSGLICGMDWRMAMIKK
jgi:hypothetical protein